MEIDKKEEHHKMIVDKTMRDLLAIPEQEEPEAVYEFWSSRLKGQKVDTVRQAFSDMRDSGHIVQTVYSWNHPVKGWIFLRFSGIFLEGTSEFLKFKGYVRQVDDPTHI